MARVMYDAVAINNIPANATMVAGYVDGHYQTYDALRQRFPHAQVVSITVFGRPNTQVADCEQGDLTPQQAAQWAKAEIAAGRKPTIYCSASPWPLVQQACRNIGLDPAKVSWWIAEYDGDPTIPAGAVAKQYKSTSVDVSSVADHWPGVDPEPPSGPHGQPPSGLGSPVWLVGLGWTDVHNVPVDNSHVVYLPSGQRLMPVPNLGWQDPHNVDPSMNVPGWAYGNRGWQPAP